MKQEDSWVLLFEFLSMNEWILKNTLQVQKDLTDTGIWMHYASVEIKLFVVSVLLSVDAKATAQHRQQKSSTLMSVLDHSPHLWDGVQVLMALCEKPTTPNIQTIFISQEMEYCNNIKGQKASRDTVLGHYGHNTTPPWFNNGCNVWICKGWSRKAVQKRVWLCVKSSYPRMLQSLAKVLHFYCLTTECRNTDVREMTNGLFTKNNKWGVHCLLGQCIQRLKLLEHRNPMLPVAPALCVSAAQLALMWGRRATLSHWH